MREWERIRRVHNNWRFNRSRQDVWCLREMHLEICCRLINRSKQNFIHKTDRKNLCCERADANIQKTRHKSIKWRQMKTAVRNDEHRRTNESSQGEEERKNKLPSSFFHRFNDVYKLNWASALVWVSLVTRYRQTNKKWNNLKFSDAVEDKKNPNRIELKIKICVCLPLAERAMLLNRGFSRVTHSPWRTMSRVSCLELQLIHVKMSKVAVLQHLMRVESKCDSQVTENFLFTKIFIVRLQIQTTSLLWW